MKLIFTVLPAMILLHILIGWSIPVEHWIVENHIGYKISYTSSDKQYREEYLELIEKGIKSTNSFFKGPFKNDFTIYIHPSRHSLDSTWQKDWNMPGFKSECWMVASGVATRLDLISPRLWDTAACEQVYAETKKTQQLITHELIHVFHGQVNSSPDFSNVEGIDWFVEGLATYASGQCDSLRITEIKKAFAGNTIPAGLDKFWTGKLRYGLSGSVVMYLDKKYGRSKLMELLPINKKSSLLLILNTTESELLNDWKYFMQNL